MRSYIHYISRVVGRVMDYTFFFAYRNIFYFNRQLNYRRIHTYLVSFMKLQYHDFVEIHNNHFLQNREEITYILDNLIIIGGV